MASTVTTNSELINSTNNKANIKTDNALILTTVEQSAIPTQAQIIHQVAGKHQMLPVVYIQTPTKMSGSKTSTNNVILNAVPQIQIQNLTPTTLTKTIPPQSLLIGKQPIVLQKSQNLQALQAVAPKNGVTYLTMLKPVSKPPETNLVSASRLSMSTINKLKSDGLQVIAASNATNSTTAQKFVIAPMPKVTSNRLPVTATTNTVQSKISFMPITLPSTAKSKVINLKITDGQIQSNVVSVSDKESAGGDVDKSLLCTETIDLDSPEKKPSVDGDFTTTTTITDDKTVISYDSNDDKCNKDTPKYPKHGVSILKKTYSALDRKENCKVNNETNLKTITTISDTDTKEVKIASQGNEEQPQKKQERRRKSTICLRKEYDEPMQLEPVEVVKNEVKVEAVPPTIGEDMEVDLITKKVREEFDNLNDVCEVANMLNWEDGIGTLPGSELKFQMNEFGFLEFLTKDEYRKIYYKKQTKVNKENSEKRSNNKEVQEEMRCVECGCYGMPADFISPKYCSNECQQTATFKECTYQQQNKSKKRKREKSSSGNNNPNNSTKKENGEVKPVAESSDEENTSNENSQDKYSYPWTNKRGFSWPKYLDHIKAKSAPVKLFKDPFPFNRNGFRPGMKLEGIDPQHPSYFCVLSVAEVRGYRLRLHFDGYPEVYDFWTNADSMDIFPAGFCEKYGHTLHPPPGFEKDFNWAMYLRQTRSTAAAKQLFANRLGNAIFPNGFRTGMKLEAVDRKNTSLVCVATIKDMMDNRILVHFDSWDDIYDYWADPTSPYIHPVGWSDQNGHSLTPPNGNDYPNPASFTWEKYLKETKSVAAPVRAFKQRPSSGFKKGMRLECVDKRVPQLIRVATVDEVKDHQLRISFDGWPDRYSYWVDDDSADIHPVGWCQKTGHPIEPPLTPDDVYDFLNCVTIGCRGQGHIKGPMFARHLSQKHCPYSDENLNTERTLPDRLLSPDRQIESVVPVSRVPKEKFKSKKAPKYPRLDDSCKVESNDEDDHDDDDPLAIDIDEEVEEEDEEEDDWSERVKPKPRIKKAPIEEVKKDPLEEEVNLEEVKMREKHSKHLIDFIKCESDPRAWTFDEVIKFVHSVPACRKQSAIFRKNQIDGMSLLMLSQQDLIEVLNFKLGPAITLYNCILLLRKTIVDCT